MAGQDWLDKDFYKILGISKDASSQDIKKQYRTLARKYHPDANMGDATAEKTFKEISEAYSVLSDTSQREQYDSIKAMGAGARFSAPQRGDSSGFEDVFSGLFGGGGNNFSSTNQTGFGSTNLPPEFANFFGSGFQNTQPKGTDLQAKAKISFAQSLQGTTLELKLPAGKFIKIRVPPGVNDGQKIRLKGKGNLGSGGAGDLFVTIVVQPHPVFVREDNNIRLTLPITFFEAALGAKIDVPTLTGEKVRVKIPAGTAAGQVLRIKNRGVVTAKAKGDLLIVVEVVVPRKLSLDAKKALESFAAATVDENPRDNFFDLARL